ncbi:MAG TPA: TolC family protein [Magnetospirillum sp.]|nr:TolC family protein [Magnetospirillum sp.]
MKSVRFDKSWSVGLVCAAALAAWTPALAQAPDAPPKAEQPKAEQTGQDRGTQRSALLVRMLGGERVVRLEQTTRQPDIVEPLRLDETVALALKNNFEIQAAGAKSDAADWEVVGAYMSYLPTVTFSRSTGSERSQPASFTVNGNRVEDNTHHRRDKELAIRQPVVDLSLISDILLRHKSQSAAELEQLGTRERIALQTIGAYYKIIQARLFIGFAEEYKGQLDKLNEMMGSRVEGGGAAQADLDRIKSRSVSAQSAIIETRSEFDASMDEFRRLTGVTPLQFQVPGSLVPVPPATIEDALVKAMRGNPDYMLSLKQTEVQQAESNKAYARFAPKVTFDVTQTRTWNAGGAGLGSSAGGNDIFPYQNERRLMLVTTWSTTGGSEIAQGLAAGAKAREANFRALDTRARVEELVRTSYNALTAAQSRIPVLEQALESNAKVMSAFEEQYMNANRPLFDLLDAYERAYSAKLDLIRVLVAEAQAAHQLRRQMGELVPSLKETELRANAPDQQEKPAE